jgi:hypothetical protein
MSLILSGTDGLSDVDGSAATPALRGTDANTGIFFPAADTIAFSEGGVESMRIDSSGNLGVGTSSPVNIAGYTIQTINNSSTGAGVYLQSNGTTVGRILNTATEMYVGGVSVDSPLIFQSGGIVRMRVNAGAPILCLDGGNTSATGTGIAFPATQSASSDANTLDDYEEGTWTPTLVGNSTAGTYTFSTSQANYTKIGRQVTVNAYLVFGTASGGSGIAKFGGLPFTKANNVLTAGNLIVSGLDFGAGTISLAIGSWTLGPSTEFYISESKDNASEVSMDIAGISTGDYVTLSMTYFT